jgi:RNA polymerase sigma-70 factor (ECF subfamily)
MIVSDAEILRNFKTKEEIGLKKMFDKYYKPLVVYSFKFVNSMAIAEDLVQDFFIRFWETKSFEQISESLKSYLFTSIRNSSLNYIKKNERVNKIPIEIISNELFFIPYDLEELEEKRTLIFDHINKLPDKSKKIFEAIILDNEKYKDVALQMGISLNTVKTQLSRSLKKLRNSLNTIVLNIIL